MADFLPIAITGELLTVTFASRLKDRPPWEFLKKKEKKFLKMKIV